MKIINSHIHIFTDKDCPNKFLPAGLVPIVRTKIGGKIITSILHNLIPFTDKDVFDRYARFVEMGKLGSQKNIFNECMKFYPPDAQACVLTMDMAFMGAGKVPRRYEQQLGELCNLKSIYGDRLRMFIHIDPRRPNMITVLENIHKKYGVDGLKIYPPLGYAPYDKRLNMFYEFCDKNKLAVISHCSPYNPVHFKGSKKELYALLDNAGLKYDKNKSNKELCSLFTSPKNWIEVAKKYKNVNFCLAHFGSEYYVKRFLNNPKEEDNWFSDILDMIEEYKNIYTDISFTYNRTEYLPLLKIVCENPKVDEKILFGSDFYMVETKCSERQFAIDIRGYLGDELFKKIAYYNPLKFLRK